MKKILACTLSAAFLVLLFTGCGNSSEENSLSNTTLTGKVTAVDGNSVTIQLGELTESTLEDMPSDGQSPSGEAPSGDGQAPSGDAPSGDGQAPSGDAPSGGGQAPSGDAPSGDGQVPSGDAPSGDGQAPSGDAPSGGGQAPSGDAPSDGGQAPSMYSFTASDESITISITDDTTIMVESMNESTAGSIDNITLDSIIQVSFDSSGDASTVTIRNIMGGSFGGNMDAGFGGSSEVTNGTSANTIDTDTTVTDTTYTSTGDDENALRIDGATVTLDGITVNKESGETSNTENGDFYGQNAGLLALNGAQVTITGASVTTTAQNGNGVFSYGDGTVVNISDSEITTTADNSGGIQTTGGATTNATNLTISTSGNSSAAIRSDRGGGTVNVNGGIYKTSGSGSPAIYSTANITVSNATLTATNSEAVVVEGLNSVTLESCDLSGCMTGTYKGDSSENIHNIMLYQSMSGDAEVGTSSFTATNSTITANAGDMFYVTNTSSVITLDNVIFNLFNDTLLTVAGNSSSRGWGTAGENGAQVEFTATNMTFSGLITVDTISTLNFKLGNGATFEGAINIVDNEDDGTAVSDNAVVTIDSGAVWTLTDDCTISSLTNNGKINFNGHTITLADGTILKG